MAMEQMRDRELVLPPSTYAFVLDSTKGRVSIYVGPNKQSLSNTDRLVTWNEYENTFDPQDDLDHAVRTFVKANEGQYVVLSDPAVNGQQHPPLGAITDATELQAGRRVIISGPAQFPLWPGQAATVIDGHHLKSNQYLLVRVYEPEQAQRHVKSAVVAPTAAESGTKASESILGHGPLTMGQLLVVQGTDVSFFVPSTGIEVLPDEHGTFIREAVTLEQMEYTILLNENGKKRYVDGPDVVFPKPTEQFVRSADDEPKARAIELNAQSGLYIKAIASYVSEEEFTLDALRGGDMIDVKRGEFVHEGDELFITGKHTPIYRPRAEHMILMYRQQRKHHAVAIPRGQGRYMLNRATGAVQLVRGPKMWLPDPRLEVNVQRILDPHTVEVMYPGNEEALRANLDLAGQQASVENVLSNQEMASAEATMTTSGIMPPAQVSGASYVGTGQWMPVSTTSMSPPPLVSESYESASPEQLMRSSSKKRGASFYQGGMGETHARGTTFTKPRTIVLNTKYQGAVEVEPYAGYAILVTNRAGERRVVSGPRSVLLDYDELPMTFSLSTGIPKTDALVKRDVYLRTINNRVTDEITVETHDLVPVTLTLSYRVNFVGEDPLKWFDVENYVALLTDHCRSRLRNVAKGYDIKTFNSENIDIVRNALLGEAEEGKRPGLLFIENAMHVYDVEVLNARIDDLGVNKLLNEAMTASMTGAIRLAQAEDDTAREARMHGLTRKRLSESERTRDAEAGAVMAELTRELTRQLKNVELSYEVAVASGAEVEHELAQEHAQFEQTIAHRLQMDAADFTRLQTETDQFIRRMEKLSGGVVDALGLFGDKMFVEKLVEAIGPLALATGVNLTDILAQVFKGTSFDSVLSTLSSRPYGGNGHIAVETTVH